MDDEVQLDAHRKKVQVREEVERVDKKAEVVHLQQQRQLQRRHNAVRMDSLVGRQVQLAHLWVHLLVQHLAVAEAWV